MSGPRTSARSPRRAPAPFPSLQELLKNPDTDVRVEAVKQLTEIGTPRSLDPLILATRDNDPEVQIRATDGLVNFYLPGYVQDRLRRFLEARGHQHQGQIHRHQRPGDRPLRHGAARRDRRAGHSWCAAAAAWTRAPMRRARWAFCAARRAVPDLVEALHSKDTDVIYESLIAMQKIRDESAGPQHQLPAARPRPEGADRRHRDHRPAAQPARRVPDLIGRAEPHQGRQGEARRARPPSPCCPTERAAPLYRSTCTTKTTSCAPPPPKASRGCSNPARSAHARTGVEGRRQDRRRAFRWPSPMVMLGQNGDERIQPAAIPDQQPEFGGLQRRSLPVPGGAGARPTACARRSTRPLETGTKDEKIGLARVLAASGDKESVPHLEKLSNDPDPDVAQEDCVR